MVDLKEVCLHDIVEVRTLTPADVKPFRLIRSLGLTETPQAFNATLSEEKRMSDEQVGFLLQERCAPYNTFVLGAFVEEQLVGFASFHREQLEKSHHKGVIWGMYIQSAMRGKKLGKSLLTQVLNRVENISGLEQIQLTVDSKSKPAKALYLSAGFTEYGYEKNAFKIKHRQPEYVDLVHMVKWL